MVCSSSTFNNENLSLLLYVDQYLLNGYTFFRQLKEENHSTKEEIKTLEAKNAEMISMLTRSDQKIVELESKLSEKEIVLKEKNALISENTELRVLTAQQHNRLKLCQQEIEDSREELNILETIISQLSLSTSEEVR